MATLIPRSFAGRFALAGSGAPGANDAMATGNVETRRCFSRWPFSVAASIGEPPGARVLDDAPRRRAPATTPPHTSGPPPGTLRALPGAPMPATDPAPLVRRLLQGDRWAGIAGARLVEVREGYARVRMRLRPEHLNGVGVVQGGAVFTLADFAFAAAPNPHGTVAVALDVSITFARAARTGVLTAEAVEETVSRRVSVCNVRVTDGAGEVVAL